MSRYKPTVQDSTVLQSVSLKLDPKIWLSMKVYSLNSGLSPSEAVQKALVFFLDSLDSNGAKQEKGAPLEE